MNLWSQRVKTVSTFPPKGIFTKPAKEVASTMARKDVSPKGIGSAIKMVQFFINRAGRNLATERKTELEKAVHLLQKMKTPPSESEGGKEVPEIVILKGLPASGKTTWALKFLSTHKDWIRTNKDELRKEFKSESKAIKARDKMIIDAINNGTNIIVDDTNLNPKHIARIKRLAKGKAKIRVKNFGIGPKEAIQRDFQRKNRVGPSVIWHMFKKYVDSAYEQKSILLITIM